MVRNADLTKVIKASKRQNWRMHVKLKNTLDQTDSYKPEILKIKYLSFASSNEVSRIFTISI